MVGSISEGLSGANTAVTREALERAGGFTDDVATGIDYHLAKRLRNAGYTICYVQSAVETEYAKTSTEFVRRHSRWLRNSFLHGREFHDKDAVISSLKTMLLGNAILFLLLTTPLTKTRGFMTLVFALGFLTTIRFRYLRALGKEQDCPIPSAVFIKLPVITFLDVVSWAVPAFELLSKRGRTKW